MLEGCIDIVDGKFCLSNLGATPFGPNVMLPDSTHVQATHSGLLPLHHSLSTTAKTAHVLDGIAGISLIKTLSEMSLDIDTAALS